MPDVIINDQNIPRMIYNGGLYYDWKNAAGISVPFIYNKTQGSIDIVSVYKNTRGDWRLIVQNGNCERHDVLSYHFIRGKLGSCIGINTKKFKLTVGQRIQDIGKNGQCRDITITNTYRATLNAFTGKFADYYCNTCDTEITRVRESVIVDGVGCSACSGKTTTVANSILNKASWMIDYFVGGEDEAKKYMPNSNIALQFKCPYCSRTTDKAIPVYQVYSRNSIGCPCRDKSISFSEKFAFYLFRSLIGERYEKEVTKTRLPWCGSYRYDGMILPVNVAPSESITDSSDVILVELHGKQHYEDKCSFGNKKSQSLADVQKNDRVKKEVAIKNGVKPEKYIVIDCRKTTKKELVHSFVDSGVLELIGYNNNDVKWDEIYAQALRSMEKEILNYANENPYETTSIIASKFSVSSGTVRRVLKDNDAFDLVARNPQIYKDKPVMVTTADSRQYCYSDLISACDSLRSLYPIDFRVQDITASIANNGDYNGFVFRYGKLIEDTHYSNHMDFMDLASPVS